MAWLDGDIKIVWVYNSIDRESITGDTLLFLVTSPS